MNFISDLKDIKEQVGMEKIIISSNDKGLQYNCDNCSLTIFNKEDLVKHFESLHKNKKYHIFLVESYLVNNSEKQPKFNEEFQCRECESAFGGLPDLKRHIKMFHLKLEPIKCNLCDFSTTSDMFLKAHMISTHNEKKEFICALCDKGFLDAKALKRHSNSVHKSMEKITQSSPDKKSRFFIFLHT